MAKQDNLTRSESQVMDVIYTIDEGTVSEVREALAEPATYSATRAILGRLVTKKMLKYQEKGPRYVYSVAGGLKKAKKTALTKLMNTFFDGSPLHTINALLGMSADKLSQEELNELAKIIKKAAEKEK